VIRRVAICTVLALALAGAPPLARAQYANQTGKVVGTIGGTCSSSTNDYAWPDTNGNILKCVSNVWTLVTLPATAAGSTGYVQFNSSGALAGSANLFWNNSSGYLGIGTAAPQSTLSVNGGVAVGTIYAGTNSAATNNLIVQGSVGIGTTSPGSTLSVQSAAISTSGGYGTQLVQTIAPTGTSGGRFNAAVVSAQPNTTNTLTGNISAGWFEVRPISTAGNITYAVGAFANGLILDNNAPNLGTVSYATGFQAIAVNSYSNTATGTITNAQDYNALNPSLTNQTITNLAGMAIQDMSAGTNNTDLLVGSVSNPTGNFGIYDTSSYPNYFSNSIGIGTVTPEPELEVYGGEVQIGSSGASCTSTNAGALRYSGGTLY
jgi:hypothetical protein